jgi:hypothetical protein
MAQVYHKLFKVPVWVILNTMTGKKNDAVQDWFAAAEARIQPWPANSYPKTLFGFREKGYAHALPEGKFNLDVALLQRSASEHVKSILGPTSYLAGSVTLPHNRINRSVTGAADLVTIFNDLLSLEDPIALSQIFQVAELCHRDDVKQAKVWVTAGPAPKGILTRIADRVITIGDEPSNDIVVKGLTKEEISDALSNYFKEFAV